MWDLTASIGPLDGKATVDGREIQFDTYWARGASADAIRDDGTIAPTAAGGSLPFAPEIVLPALKEMRRRYGPRVFQRYGFIDAFNATFAASGLKPRPGDAIEQDLWFTNKYLGIDQGPITRSTCTGSSSRLSRSTERSRRGDRSRTSSTCRRKRPFASRGIPTIGPAAGCTTATSWSTTRPA